MEETDDTLREKDFEKECASAEKNKRKWRRTTNGQWPRIRTEESD